MDAPVMWHRRTVCHPTKGQAVWLYDSMFGMVIPWTVVGDPAKMDGDFTHWAVRDPRDFKPEPPADAKVHAKGYPLE